MTAIATDQVWQHERTGQRVTVTRVKTQVRDVVVRTAAGRAKSLAMVTLRRDYRLVGGGSE